MFLSGCGGTKIESYQGSEPVMSFEEFFTGPVQAWGIVQDRDGKVIRQFEITMNGSWNADGGTLQEDFTYYDGKTERRVWAIKRSGDHQYTATADGIVGTATGKSAGHATLWKYVMTVPVDGKTYDITFDDWMFQMRGGVIINRSYMTKFGIRVGDITLFIKKGTR